MKRFVDSIIIVNFYGIFERNLPTGFSMRKNGRSNPAIIYKLSGKTIYSFNGKEYVSDSKHIILMPANTPYGCDIVEKGTAYQIEFETLNRIKKFYSFDCNKKEIIDCLNEIIAKNGDYMTSKNYFFEKMYKLLQIMSNQEAGNTREDEIYKYGVNYLQNNFKTITNIYDEIPNKLGISEIYFRKVFTKKALISPKKFLSIIRMNEAKRLLIQGYAEKEICKMVGYDSIYAFSRAFKLYEKESAKEFKQRHI